MYSLRIHTKSAKRAILARLRRNICNFALKGACCTLIVSGTMQGCRENNGPSNSLYHYYVNESLFAGKGMVYRYEPVTNPELPAEYWHYRVLHDWRGNTLKAALYDPTGQITQEMILHLKTNSAELMSLEIMYPTETGQQSLSPQINASAVFPFGAVDSTAEAYYQIEYWDTAEDSVRVILSKNRTLTGRTEYQFEGQLQPAIRFDVREILETETQGFTETTWTSTEIYAQDIGLVYYKKEISEQFVLEYKLVERMPFDEFMAKNR